MPAGKPSHPRLPLRGRSNSSQRIPTGKVVIDIDEEIRLEPAQRGTLKAIALQQNRRIIGTLYALRHADRILLLGDGGKVPEQDRPLPVDLLAHLPEQHTHRQHGTDGVAIGPRMGANQKAFALAENLENRRRSDQPVAPGQSRRDNSVTSVANDCRQRDWGKFEAFS